MVLRADGGAPVEDALPPRDSGKLALGIVMTILGGFGVALGGGLLGAPLAGGHCEGDCDPAKTMAAGALIGAGGAVTLVMGIKKMRQCRPSRPTVVPREAAMVRLGLSPRAAMVELSF